MANGSEIPELVTKLELVRGQLAYLEDLKRKEHSLRKEEAEIAARLEELQSAHEFFGNGKGDDGWDTVPKKRTKPMTFSSPAVNSIMRDAPGGPEDARKKRLKALNKKLAQIAELKKKGPSTWDDEQQAKVKSEGMLLKEKAALEAGQEWDSEAEDDDPEDEGRRALPEDAAEREKRVKVLQKKLKQIAELRDKPSSELNAEARQKIAGEIKLKQELAALEGGEAEVVYDETEVKTAEKVEVEKKLKAVKKKVAQIASLKESKQASDFTEEEKAKVAAEKALKKEISELEHKISTINKEERDRVAERLGWEVEQSKKKKKANRV